MRKILLSLLALTSIWYAKADEGMWLPYLINKNIKEMQSMGFRLSADDIYSANNASLKDAIVQFGGGCTAELISPNGLLLTNHHCGYSYIADLSTVEKNYLENGFWAKSYKDEIPAPGLTVKFLVSMEDVTEFVMPKKEYKTLAEREKAMQPVIEKITKDASENGKYVAEIRGLFNGNQYILYKYQIYNDVRLVATPPDDLGKYGGDTDNWMWPRHTADFSIFRVYADKNNQPAPYSPDNVPFKSKHFLPISLKGVNEADFAMIMGYPGRTNRYATSYEIDMAINEVNPSIVHIREARLAIMRKYMNEDPAVNLKLASKYAQIANYWKYFIGQTEQLKRLKVVARKQKEEAEYTAWATKNKMNANLMTQFQSVVGDYRPYAKSVVYFSEAFYGSNVARLGALANQLRNTLSQKNPDQAQLQKQINSLKQYRKTIMEEFVYNVEKEIFAKMTEMMYKELPKEQHPDVYRAKIFPNFGNHSEQTYAKYADFVMKNTFLLDDIKFERFCANPTLKELEADPAVIYANSFVSNFENNIRGHLETYNAKKADLSYEYTAGLMKKNEGNLMYPDANSTMRITYGSVKSYKPKDAVFYDYKTYIDGLMDKYIPGDLEFDLPQDFIKLVESRDFGRYADETGNLPVNFITNNDITGGNSGSPVINGRGELIGLAFDGNWEAMSGDIAFDQNYKRTIAVDARFILWIIEKYGKADNLIREMDIRY